MRNSSEALCKVREERHNVNINRIKYSEAALCTTMTILTLKLVNHGSCSCHELFLLE